MYRRHGQKLALVFLLVDLGATACAWWGAYALRFSLWPAPDGVPELGRVMGGLPWVWALAAYAYWQVGLYDVDRLRQLPRELATTFRAGGLLLLLTIAATFLRRDLYESRLALGLFLVLNVATLSAARRGLWRVLRLLRARGLNRGRAVVIGSGRLARIVFEQLATHRWTGLEVVGYVDREQDPGEVRGLERVGTLQGLTEVVRRHDVDHVFIALPLARYGELPAIYAALDEVLVEVQLVPDVPQRGGLRPEVATVGELPLVQLRRDPHRGWSRWVKRGMDLVVGSLALACFAPLMLTLAVGIKLTSPGPIFYRQARLGRRNRAFGMWKFRSMRVDAERTTGPKWAQADDQRCTPLGRVMRRWSLDELPQLFNVLAGEMSLVGPRPERAVFVERFGRQLPGYCQRHRVQVGMTGWAQVNGWRGNTSVRHRLEHDLHYIAHWSWWLDVKILWLTIWRGFRHRNAY